MHTVLKFLLVFPVVHVLDQAPSPPDQSHPAHLCVFEKYTHEKNEEGCLKSSEVLFSLSLILCTCHFDNFGSSLVSHFFLRGWGGGGGGVIYSSAASSGRSKFHGLNLACSLLKSRIASDFLVSRTRSNM